MTERHPLQSDLPRDREMEVGEPLTVYLHGRLQPGDSASDHHWLDKQIAAALEGGAKGVPLPRPRWEKLHGQLKPRQRPIEYSQLLAVGGAAMVACLMLAAPLALSREVRAEGALAPSAATAPCPVSVSDWRAGYGTYLALTMTPDSAVSSVDRALSLPFVPPPEPPVPET